MSQFYALTVNTTCNNSRAPSVKTYNRSLDALEKKYAVEIFPRMFETGPKTGKLHCHCLVTQKLGEPLITEMKAEKNKNILVVPVTNKQGWLNYSSKDQPVVGSTRLSKSLFKRSS